VVKVTLHPADLRGSAVTSPMLSVLYNKVRPGKSEDRGRASANDR
jgi:hypothetical protein